MIIGPWKVNVPLHVYMCTHVHILVHPPPISERDTVHINSVFVFQSPFKRNCSLTWLFHSTGFIVPLSGEERAVGFLRLACKPQGCVECQKSSPLTPPSKILSQRTDSIITWTHEQLRSNRPTFQKGWVIGFPLFQVKIAWKFYCILGSQDKI